MSLKKIVTGVVAVALVVAGVATGNPGLIIAGLSTGLNLLKPSGPKAPAHAQERLQATFDVNAPRKIVFGRTAMATDLRYQAYTGTDQEYLHQILCVASHECEAIEELWFDSKMAWSAAGGVTADFAAYLTVAVRNPGTSGNGIAIDSVWTSSCTLTGCAYLHLRYKLTGADKKHESPFAQSIPSRVTVRGKGARVPDLRVAGVDVADQTTWVYSDAGSDSGRNPSWQRLFYLVGWRIEGKLALGRGLPPARIDLDSHTTAANVCDETVALDVGGSEPRYRADMVYSEAETPQAVLGNINATMDAVPTDDGGRIGVVCLLDDLDDPDILELSDDDLADPAEENWSPEAEIDEIVNIVRGRYTDATDASLYQPAPEQEVALGTDLEDFGSPDGIQRLAPFDGLAVQSGTQWQRLATRRLRRAQVPGLYRARFKAKAWLARMWKPVSFTHRGLGFVDKKFRVVGMELPTGSFVTLMLRADDASIYDWDESADEGPIVEPDAPTPWDWTNDPTLGGIDESGLTADWPDITSRPTELTDGRITAALDSSGDLARNITTARRNTSNLLGYSGGATFSGELTADVTSTHTAAAIASQGALATLSAASWASQVSGRPTELTDGRITAGLDASGDLNRNIGSSRANTSNLLRYTSGGLFTGELAADVTLSHVAASITGQGALATLGSAAWGSQVSGRPTELTDGRITAALDSSGDLARNITTARRNSSNLLGYTGGATFSGELTADVTSTHTAAAIASQGALATLGAAAWGSQVSGRPTELTDGRITAALDSSGDLARNIVSSRANTSNLLRYTSGGLFTGELAADVTLSHVAASITGQGALATLGAAAWGSQVSGRPTELTDGRITAALDSSGDLARNLTSARANTSNLLRYTSGGLFTGELAADVTLSHVAASITGQGALATLGAAAWGSQVSGRPTELTDGRITAALDSSGDLARNIVSSRANTSNLLRYTSGGLFTGELAADITSTHTAAAITGQSAIATDADAVNRILAMRGDSIARNGYFSEGQTGTVRGTDASYVTLGGATNPAPHGVRFAANPANNNQSYFWLNDSNAVPFAHNVLYVSAWVKSAVASQLTLSAQCYAGDGTTLLSVPTAAVTVAASGSWQLLEGRIALDPLTYSVKIYLQRTGTLTNTFDVTGVRAAATSLGATVGAVASTNLFRSDGVTVLTQADVRTVEGIAASITGQGALATLGSAAWGSQVSGRPTELTDGRITAALDSSGDLARNLTSARANTSNLLRYTSGGLFTGELAADVTLSHVAASITGQGALATLGAAAWGSQVSGRPTELTDGRITAALDSSGDLARNIVSSRANTSNLLRYTSGGLFTGELAADITSTHTASAIASQGALATLSTVTWSTHVTGSTRPADNADATVVPVAIGTGTQTVAGNSVTKTGGTAFDAAVYLPPVAGSQIVEMQIHATLWSMVGYDATSAGPDRSDQLIFLQYNAGSGSCSIYAGASLLENPTVAAGKTGKIQIVYDGRYYYFWVGDAYYGTPVAASAYNLTLYPKMLSYDAGTRAGFRSRPFADRNWQRTIDPATGVANDSRIMPANVIYALLPSLKDIVTLSDTDNSGTVTINIGAAVFYPDNGGTVTFPSGSSAGKAYGTKYYIKRTGVNPVSAPTGTAWNVSTTLSIGVGEVYVNYYTTRASGGAPSPPAPPSPGGGGDCVAADAWVETRARGFVQARYIVAGDLLRVLTQDRDGTDWAPCLDNHLALTNSFTIRSASGIELSLSETTPISLRDGSTIKVAEISGHDLPVLIDGHPLEWEACEAKPNGRIVVAHIYCGQRTYAAGNIKGRSILTHNVGPGKP